jgi:hypothetical protein
LLTGGAWPRPYGAGRGAMRGMAPPLRGRPWRHAGHGPAPTRGFLVGLWRDQGRIFLEVSADGPVEEQLSDAVPSPAAEGFLDLVR